MVWTSYDSRTGQRSYRSGPGPFDQWGFEASRPIYHDQTGTQSYTYTSKPTGGVQRWDWVADLPSSTPGTAVAPPPQTSVATGIDPGEISNALYGKPIPLSALGLARIGTAGLIFGPYMNAGAASFAVSFGFPANPEGTRRVYEISLDSKVAWELAAGSPAGALDAAGFLAAPFQCRFYSGTQTQAADPLEAARFGVQAVAYRPQMMLWFQDLPLAPFDGKVPFVSCKIGDVTDGAVPADGINLGNALELIGYSPWLEYDASSFQVTGVQDIVQAMILTEDQSFLNLLQVTARVYRTLDIIQTDMLRINDRGLNVTPDVTFGRDHISVENGVEYNRQEESSVAREMELITIDPDADFVFMPSKAARPLAPVPVTSSKGKDSITLPVVIGATTRAALVTYAKYDEDISRKRVVFQSMLYGYELEPGDLFRLNDIAAGFDDGEVWQVVETSHGANWVVDIVGEAILKCALVTEDATDPYWTYVVLLLGFEDADGSTGAPGFTDESPAEHGTGSDGGAEVDTAQFKFGSSSLNAGGVGSIYFTGSTDWDLSDVNSDQFTIECWAKTTTTTPASLSLVWFGGTAGSRGFRFWVDATGGLAFGASLTGANHDDWGAASSPLLWETTGWYHLAVDKDATGKVRVYRDGAMLASSTPANSTMNNPASFLQIGANNAGSALWQGWIDEVRITKIARYASDSGYSVPTAAFARGE